MINKNAKKAHLLFTDRLTDRQPASRKCLVLGR